MLSLVEISNIGRDANLIIYDKLKRNERNTSRLFQIIAI
jgi:hypothetical protein